MAAARHRLVLGAVLASAVLGGGASPAHAAGGPVRRGSFALGGAIGYAALQLQDLNALIDAINQSNMTRYNDLNGATEFVGEVRYAVWSRVSLGLEAGYLKGTSDDPVEGGEIQITAIPVAATVAWTVHDEPGISVRLLGGMGAMVNATFSEFSETGGGDVSGSSFLVDLGVEIEWRPVRAIGISGQAIARSANVENPDGFLTDLDMSGGSFRLGMRGYFGGRPE
jgi:hypothetical protein